MMDSSLSSDSSSSSISPPLSGSNSSSSSSASAASQLLFSSSVAALLASLERLLTADDDLLEGGPSLPAGSPTSFSNSEKSANNGAAAAAGAAGVVLSSFGTSTANSSPPKSLTLNLSAASTDHSSSSSSSSSASSSLPPVSKSSYSEFASQPSSASQPPSASSVIDGAPSSSLSASDSIFGFSFSSSYSSSRVLALEARVIELEDSLKRLTSENINLRKKVQILEYGIRQTAKDAGASKAIKARDEDHKMMKAGALGATAVSVSHKSSPSPSLHPSSAGFPSPSPKIRPLSNSNASTPSSSSLSSAPASGAAGSSADLDGIDLNNIPPHLLKMGNSIVSAKKKTPFKFPSSSNGMAGGVPTGGPGAVNSGKLNRILEAPSPEEPEKKIPRDTDIPTQPQQQHDTKPSAPTSATSSAAAASTPFAIPPPGNPHEYKVRLSLRHHLDNVRCLLWESDDVAAALSAQLNGGAGVLVTGSDDATIKLWNVSEPLAPVNAKKAYKAIEPVYTFRGHKHLLTCVALHHRPNSTSVRLYSASADGDVVAWTLPSLAMDPYAELGTCDPQLAYRLRHDEAVWSVAASATLLAVACANGHVYLYHHSLPGTSAASSALDATRPVAVVPMRTPRHGSALQIPTSLAFCSGLRGQLAVGLTSGEVAFVDVEKGSVCSVVDNASIDLSKSPLPPSLAATNAASGLSVSPSSQFDTPLSHLLSLASHPQLPLLACAHADRHVRFADARAPRFVDALLAHSDAVSAVSFDGSGSVLASAAHDGAVRMWSVAQRGLMQHMDTHQTHRHKFDEAIHALAFHPTLGALASGGADAIAKVYV